jgi:hypothetical protein
MHWLIAEQGMHNTVDHPALRSEDDQCSLLTLQPSAPQRPFLSGVPDPLSLFKTKHVPPLTSLLRHFGRGKRSLESFIL